MSPSHSWLEDLFSLAIGVLVVSVAIVVLKQAGVLVGGVAGLALLIGRVFELEFGPLFFALSAPFYLMAWFRMNRVFTLKSLGCVGLIAWLSELLGQRIAIDGLSPMMAAVVGGVLCGLGLLALFRHNASAGGFNVLVMYCQERFNLRAGYLQMGLDLVILVATFLLFSAETLLASTLCIVLMNGVLGVNHRPGRYTAQPGLVRT
ncbi:YitT family protein [Ferrimonas marina]|uniref:Uncharacterized 5xTM membrane BCR, YitT family COG1284 n=1 Tax=Ferrimonas marina TaxID=299255 RepID=A0A1M5RXR3_9GAMM|nr:YitT family protein [Ferrimonas marina]SHH31157.1 Uncharacterised 5xTM membrane BCR, YitT family COG1284 [Ferrimonas marina]